MKKTNLLTALAAGAFALAGGSAFAAEKVVIAIGTSVFDASQANNTSLPFFTKCWEKEGLNVELQPTSSTAAMQAVLSGQANMVNMGPAAGVIARGKGAPLTAVYVNMRKNFQFPVVLESSPIKTIADFKGKTMGVFSYGAQMVKVFRGMAAESGLNPDTDLNIVETGVGAQAITALQTGRVDIWGTWDSQIATAENAGLKLRRFTTPAAEKLTWGGSYFVRDDYVKSNPQAIEKTLRCIAQGSVYAIANPEAAVKAHWQIYPATKPTGIEESKAFQQALHLLNTRIEFLKLKPGEKWGEFPHQMVAETVKFMRDTGELQADLDPKVLYTNQFVEGINRFDAKAVEAAAKAAK
jgi:NitT/TauT family transport system substrate-binding protein